MPGFGETDAQIFAAERNDGDFVVFQTELDESDPPVDFRNRGLAFGTGRRNRLGEEREDGEEEACSEDFFHGVGFKIWTMKRQENNANL